MGNIHHYDMGMLLDRLGIAVRTGHHCAQPLMHALGIEGTVRASFSFIIRKRRSIRSSQVWNEFGRCFEYDVLY